ncbi:MAG: PD-(D/E)XK nuclease family protein [Campylobacterota bacterium]|nr:PD-(D/E)XK nuclease family protein [Campylobacterota bacterium]
MLTIKNKKESILVFPTSRAIRGYLSSLKNSNQLLNKNITIADLFQRSVLDRKNRKLCEKNLKILFLKEAISNVKIEELGISGDFSTFLKQSDYIFRFFLETANEYIEFDRLLEFDTYLKYSDHIEILQQIHKNYSQLLEDNNYTDNIFMPKNYILNSDYVEQFNDITIYLEGYLSSYEFNIIKDISKTIETKIKISINEYNKKNIELFPMLIEDLKINYNYTIDLTNNKILEKIKIKNIKQDIIISPVSSQLEQISFIKYQIMQMSEEGIEPENIAVVVPNEKISLMLELFDDEHYFNFAMGRSIQNNKITKVTKLINKILVDKEPKDIEKLKFLDIKDEDYISIFKNNWDKSIDKNIFNMIINYLFTFEDDEDVLEKLEQLKISLDILLFTQIYPNNSIVLDIKVKEFIKLFINQLSTISIDDISGGKITVLGILETRAIEYEAIIVIDFNDDKIPKLSVKDKFISTHIKQLAKLPTVNDRENLQRYYYKRFFDKAKQIAICYIDDEQSVMSRFVVQLFSNYKQFLVKKDYKSILFNKKILNHFYKDIVLDIDLSKKEWSATSLKTYLTCKRKYYYNYIQNIKDHTISIKPQSFEVGSIIHNALEQGVKNSSLNTQFINQYLTTYSKNNPYLILELELWKKKLEKFIEFEEVRAKNNIKIFSVEQPFNINYNGVKLKGKIDRIDMYSDNKYEILDYKTSSNLKIDTLKNYEDTVDFQLEFYYLSQRDKMIQSVGYYDLNDSSIKSEVVLNEKLELLDMHLSKLKTKTVDFNRTDIVSNCQYCIYKTICCRD